MILFDSEPHIVRLPSIGDTKEGYITVAEFERNIPFPIRRVYWTYYTPHEVNRGFHAHRKLKQVIFAVSGQIKFKVETRSSLVFDFVLEKPNEGLYLPPFTWREIQFSHSSVLMCLASEWFDETDYIRDYKQYKNEA
jgi:hypothetical protein